MFFVLLHYRRKIHFPLVSLKDSWYFIRTCSASFYGGNHFYMKIVVLGGGVSTERNVAQVTATSVCQALRRRGHQAIYVDMFLGMENYDKPLEEAFSEPDGLCGAVEIRTEAPDLQKVWNSRKKQSASRLGKNVIEICAMADCVFLGLHGKDGEDGKIQAILEMTGVPYTGSGPLASALAMNKAMAKRVLMPCGIRTPAWQEIVYEKESYSGPYGGRNGNCIAGRLRRRQFCFFKRWRRSGTGYSAGGFFRRRIKRDQPLVIYGRGSGNG